MPVLDIRIAGPRRNGPTTSVARGRTALRAAAAFFALGFCVGTFTHLRDTLELGLFGYRSVPQVVNIFWTCLLAVDPLTAALLFIAPAAGLIAGSAVMVADIGINLWIILREYALSGRLDILYFAFQLPFGVAILLYTTTMLHRRRLQTRQVHPSS